MNTSVINSPTGQYPRPYVGMQNPFTLDRLVKQRKAIQTTKSACGNSERGRMIGLDADLLHKQLTLLAWIIDGAISDERAKPDLIRAYGNSGDDESWKQWIVLTREATAKLELLPVEPWNLDEDDIPGEWHAAQVWAELGFDPAGRGCNREYSPSGECFTRRASIYMHCGHLVITQSGGRDI